jgi:hypothetical protein
MVATIRYPSGHSADDWGLIISSAVAAGIPDGDVVYMFVNPGSYSDQRVSQDKTNRTSGRRARRRARGRVLVDARAHDVWIPSRSMTELNTLNGYLDSFMDKDHAPVYMWVRTKDAAAWVWKDFPDVDGNEVDYLMGYLDINRDVIGDAFLKTIKFSNAYQGGS